ncbi:helix-turn-helix transcriptional regulator [Haloferula sp.]|uniref:helix-turn-helix transcriptional regulator n=1 Tax=Haloferula sp. TaxID=2497595 RepID=UPI003C709744
MPNTVKQGRAGRTRAPMERIYHIHEAVASGRLPNCSVLAEELEVTPKTIQRDITFMRDRLSLPIEYDDPSYGYRYTEDVSTFPVFEMGAEELAGLFLSRQALESVRGTQLEQTMREVFAKLTRSIEGKVKFAWADLDKALSRKPGAVTKTDLKLFGNLAEAVLKRREVAFDYRKLGSDRSEKRRIQPYHLGEVDQCWYLIGYDLDRKGLRTFAFPRIRAAKTHKETFKVPDDFNGPSYLGTSFGIWTDPERPDFKQEVRIELSGYAARLVQERRWHPSQQVTPLNATASRVEVRFEVGRLEELVRWTLSWGSQAKVKEPKELRDRVKAEAAKIL